ncbi:Hsp20/alpha crystallin family protein [Sinorhizobium sp. GL28]|uniref:Hsp20/alpha crystallin family protein n=1 Tax=Sinorhizobium sp. GL28 TaxID=1358418 RepID=UPI00071DEDF6|nr:Hsp20/alpha crystallin family protein [Sinorhizobium sp. GL28]
MAEPATPMPTKPEEKAIKRGTEAWIPFEGLRTEIDRLFDDFPPNFWSRPLGMAVTRRAPFLSNWAVAPAVDLIEREKNYEITAELPGMEEKDVEISVSNGTLTIRGEKQEAKEEKEKEYVLSERRFGSFRRTFKIPEDVKTDDVAATFSKGVLTLTLPKTEHPRQNERKIQISTD